MKIFTWTTEMEALEALPSSAVPKVPKHTFLSLLNIWNYLLQCSQVYLNKTLSINTAIGATQHNSAHL